MSVFTPTVVGFSKLSAYHLAIWMVKPLFPRNIKSKIPLERAAVNLIHISAADCIRTNSLAPDKAGYNIGLNKLRLMCYLKNYCTINHFSARQVYPIKPQLH